MPQTPKISAILMAAGLSKRLGRNKLLIPLNGTPVVRLVAQSLLSSQASEIIVVTGHEGQEVRSALDGLDLRLIHNPHYEEGQSTSLASGLSQTTPDTDGYLFVLGDQPFLVSSLVDRLIEAFGSADPRPLAVAPFYKGQRGNPVLISSKLFGELKELKGDEGARKILRRIEVESPNLFFALEIDQGEAFWDLDTEADYEKILSRIQSKEKHKN